MVTDEVEPNSFRGIRPLELLSWTKSWIHCNFAGSVIQVLMRRFGESKGSFCTLASFCDKESLDSSSGSEESSEDSLKGNSPSPLSTPTKQSLQVTVREKSGFGGLVRLRSSRGDTMKAGNGNNRGRRGYYQYHHHHHHHQQQQPWYSLISPPWMGTHHNNSNTTTSSTATTTTTASTTITTHHNNSSVVGTVTTAPQQQYHHNNNLRTRWTSSTAAHHHHHNHHRYDSATTQKSALKV
uniref:Uncharacterized protein n=1 Tax=Rhodnius prolixus TaxID=13249 RepID=T1I822_RHOPR